MYKLYKIKKKTVQKLFIEILIEVHQSSRSNGLNKIL